MGRKVDVDDLVTAAMIAERLGLSDARVVHVWQHRYDDFPQPVVWSERIRVWVWPDIIRWSEKTGRASK